MRKILAALCALSLTSGCVSLPTPAAGQPVSTVIPGASVVCKAIGDTHAFDTALRTYTVAVDAIHLLVMAKQIVPGSPKAVAIAQANDEVLAMFSAAEKARTACKATDYRVALGAIDSAVLDLRAAFQQ